MRHWIGLGVVLAMALIAKPNPGGAEAAGLRFPKQCTVEAVARHPHPVVFLGADEAAAARQGLKRAPWLRAYLASCRRTVAPLMKLDDDALRALVPPPGTPIVYGLGMNLCPQGERLRWGGWKNPYKVLGKGNVLYPNDQYKDDGKRFFFTARAHGFLFSALEEQVLPALADCYLLTGDVKYAHVAAVLLDAIACSYCRNRRGPIDYPISPGDEKRGGRLQRPYYQAARGLMNYVHAVDAILPSNELARPSVVKGRTRWDNVARDLLWDGAAYCHECTQGVSRLHNGHADYARGAAAVGILLDVPALAEPMFSPTIGLPAMLATSLDRDGFYHESSHTYSIHCIELYLSMAELYLGARRMGWKGVPDMFAHPALLNLLDRYVDKLEVGGRLPLYGDAGPLRQFNHPLQRVTPPGKPMFDREFTRQLENVWLLLVRGADATARENAARFLRNAYGDLEPVPPLSRRTQLFLATPEVLAKVKALPRDPEFFETKSVLYPAKGLALLRGGSGANRHGVQLLFGAMLNHGQREALSWTFYNHGGEWSYDPGYWNAHYRFGWTSTSVAHQQMVVDGGSAAVHQGGAQLLAWQPDEAGCGVQFVMASQPRAFPKTRRFDRLIAQADHPQTGELEYWLDVGIVEGGEMRDDSFHTLFTKADYSCAFTPTGDFSLFGDVAKGMHFQNDLRLSGYPDKPFYWWLPGNGYGLLLQPASCKTAAAVTARFHNAFLPKAKEIKTSIRAFFPGEPGREYLSVRSMAAPNAPSLEYLIRRDRGTAPSVFAKVLCFEPDGGKPAVQAVEAVSLDGGDAASRAWIVRLADGRADLWMVGAPGRELRAKLPVGEVRCDGRVAVVRFDEQGKALAALASEAARLSFGEVALSGVPRHSGTLEQIGEPRPGEVRFEVKWNGPAPQARGLSRMAVVANAHGGLPSNWAVAAVEGTALAMAGVRFPFSVVRFSPAPGGKTGRYIGSPEQALLFGPSGQGPHRPLAKGLLLRLDGKTIGTIRAVDQRKDARLEYDLADFDGKPLRLPRDAQVQLCEAMPGARITLPGSIAWKR